MRVEVALSWSWIWIARAARLLLYLLGESVMSFEASGTSCMNSKVQYLILQIH